MILNRPLFHNFKIIFTLIIIISIESDLIGQNPIIENEINNNDFIFVTVKMKFDSKNKEIIKNNITNQLKIDLAQKIFSNVKVNTNSSSNQSSETVNSNNSKNKINTTIYKTEFNSNSNITSNIILPNPFVEFKIDEKNKTITGIMSVNKDTLVFQNYKFVKGKVENTLIKIDAIELNYNLSTRLAQNHYNEIKKEHDVIKNLYEIISIYNDNILQTDSELRNKLDRIESFENQLLTKIESFLFQDQLKTVLDLKNGNEFKKALENLKKLIIDYPENNTLFETKKSLLNDVEKYYSNDLLSFDYLLRLKAIEEMELIDNSFVEKFAIQKKIYRTNASEQYYKKIKFQIENKDYLKANDLLNEIENYNLSDEKTYNNLKNQINSGLFNVEVGNINNEIKNKKFHESIPYLNKAKLYVTNKSDNEIIEKKREIIAHGISKNKIKELKLNRPFTYQIQFGYTTITQPNFDLNNLDITNQNNLNYINIYQGINLGVHRRLIHYDKASNNNKIRAGSSTIGFNINMWLPGSISSKELLSISDNRINNVIWEPQVSFFVFRFLNLNIGKIFINQLDIKKIESNNDFYSLTCGIKPRIKKLHFSTGLKLLSNFENREYYSMYLSIGIGLNFKRKFYKNEKNEIFRSTEKELH